MMPAARSPTPDRLHWLDHNHQPVAALLAAVSAGQSRVRVFLDLPPARLVEEVRSRSRVRKNPVRRCYVVKSGEQLKRSEVPGCRSGQTGCGLAVGAVGPRCGSSVLSLLRNSLLLSVFLAAMTPGAETNSLPSSSGSAIHHPPPSPQEVAAAHERAGRKRQAAALYETKARTNPAARKVLSHRLLALYTETGETNKALTWAREVMRDNPDPQAYLAAVQARLGQWQEARGILEHEIAINTNATRAVTLRWQLAEVYAQEGDGATTSRLLSEAASLANGTGMDAAARRRVDAARGCFK
jgi:tetratricopeptide (TPR) repeat protein